tara:strand:- start:227 stop:391 length:165 start_codon:yes stop_codon:yes gene_type:complete
VKWFSRLFFSAFLFLAGWLFNFVFDIQFALGVAAGWLMREGYDNLGNALIELIK